MIEDVYGLADEVRMKHQRMDSAVNELKMKLNVPPEFAEEKAREILTEMESVDPQLIMNENGNELDYVLPNKIKQNSMKYPISNSSINSTEKQMKMMRYFTVKSSGCFISLHPFWVKYFSTHFVNEYGQNTMK